MEESPVEYNGFLEKDLKDGLCRNEQLYPFNSYLMNIYNEPGPMFRVKKIITMNKYALSLCFFSIHSPSREDGTIILSGKELNG